MLIALAVEPTSLTVRQFETIRATNQGWLCAPGGNDNPDAEFECIWAIGRLASRLSELDASLLRSVGWAAPSSDFTISNGGELVLEAVTNQVIVPSSTDMGGNPPVITIPVKPEGSEVATKNLVLPLTSCNDNKIQFSAVIPANDPQFDDGDEIDIKSQANGTPISNIGNSITETGDPITDLLQLPESEKIFENIIVAFN